MAGWQPDACLGINGRHTMQECSRHTAISDCQPYVYIHSHRIPALNHCTSQHNSSPIYKQQEETAAVAISSVLPFTGNSSDVDQHDYIRLKKQKQKSCVGMPCVLILRQNYRYIPPHCYHYHPNKANKWRIRIVSGDDITLTAGMQLSLSLAVNMII